MSFRSMKKNQVRSRLLRFESLESRQLLSATPNTTDGNVVTVTTLKDVVDADDGLVSLREAVNTVSTGGTINFAQKLAGGVIQIELNTMQLMNAVTIDGGDLGISIDAQNACAIFAVTGDGITLKGLTFKNAAGLYGGALGNIGTMTIEDCTFLNSSAVKYGGGIGNAGDMIIRRCTFINCTCQGYGGAVYTRSPLTIIDSVFQSNSAEYGGGLFVARNGSADISGSFFIGNKADGESGGAVYVWDRASASISDTILKNNTSTQNGSAISIFKSPVTLNNLLVTGNSSGTGGVIHIAGNSSAVLNAYNITVADNNSTGVYRAAGTVNLYNSIVVNNDSGDKYGTVMGANNLSSVKIGTGTVIYDSSADLFAEGGYVPAAGSQAVDSGNNEYVQGVADLAGETRVVNGIVDIGAYEYQIPPEITDVTLVGWAGVYDGEEHSVTVVDPMASSDTVLYSLDGILYELTAAPSLMIGDMTVYVKVSRAGYSDWYGEADVSIAKRTVTIEGTSVDDKVYDGTDTASIHLGSVAGVLKGDDVAWSVSGQFPSSEVGNYIISVTYKMTGEDALFYDGPKSAFCFASIVSPEQAEADLAPITVSAVDKYTKKTIDLLGAGMSTGNTAQVTVTFRNVGTKATDVSRFYNAVRVKNTDTGAYIINADESWYERYYSAGILEPGEEGAFNFLMPKLAAGNYVIEVNIDNRAVVTESDKENNKAEYAFSVADPDLVPVTVTAYDKYTSEPIDILNGGMMPNNIAQVAVWFRNDGSIATSVENFYSGVRVKNLKTGTYVVGTADSWYERFYSDGILEPGEAGSFTFLMPRLSAGTYQLEVEIDNRNVVRETINGNNYAIYKFTVGYTDLVPASISAVDQYTKKNIDVMGGGMTTANVAQVTVNFRNDGSLTAEPGKFYSAVRLRNADTGAYIINDDSSWYERFYSGGPIESGKKGSFSFLMPKLAAGNYVLEVDINSRRTVDEKDYSNNFVEYKFSVNEVSKAEIADLFADEFFVEELTAEF